MQYTKLYNYIIYYSSTTLFLFLSIILELFDNSVSIVYTKFFKK
jgi:hypothetical protein